MTTLGTDERDGGSRKASPIHAQHWLRAWNGIGGGITLGIDRSVNPWRIIREGDPAEGCHVQTLLLQELDETPGLKAAVRVIISTEAMQRANRALRAMGRPGLFDDEGETRP